MVKDGPNGRYRAERAGHSVTRVKARGERRRDIRKCTSVMLACFFWDIHLSNQYMCIFILLAIVIVLVMFSLSLSGDGTWRTALIGGKRPEDASR